MRTGLLVFGFLSDGEDVMRFLARCVLFFFGFGLVGLAIISNMHFVSMLIEPFRTFLFGSRTWSVVLTFTAFYLLARGLYIMRFGERLRTPEMPIVAGIGSLLLLASYLQPKWVPIPAGWFEPLSTVCVIFAGISLMWMQTFSSLLSRLYYDKVSSEKPKQEESVGHSYLRVVETK